MSGICEWEKSPPFLQKLTNFLVELIAHTLNTALLGFPMITSIFLGYFTCISLTTISFYRSRANNYLSLSLFLLASLTFLEWADVNTSSIAVYVIGNFRLDFLFAVITFTYFLIQMEHQHLKSRWYKWLYLPAIGSVVIELFIFAADYFFAPRNTDLDRLILIVKDTASLMLNIFLICWGRRLIKNAPTISAAKRHWLLQLNLIVGSIIMSWLVTRIELYIFHSVYTYYLLWGLLSLCFWWVLYYGIFRLQIIAQKEELHEHLVAKKVDSTKKKKKINSRTTSKIVTQLHLLMEEEALYKNPLLGRSDVATRIGVSEGYLSQVINQEINKSIIQFIKEYRVEAAKRLLHDPLFNKYSVEAIGMEAGFNSKSAFYTIFKTSLGMSPGAYRKLQKTS